MADDDRWTAGAVPTSTTARKIITGSIEKSRREGETRLEDQMKRKKNKKKKKQLNREPKEFSEESNKPMGNKLESERLYGRYIGFVLGFYCLNFSLECVTSGHFRSNQTLID